MLTTFYKRFISTLQKVFVFLQISVLINFYKRFTSILQKEIVSVQISMLIFSAKIHFYFAESFSFCTNLCWSRLKPTGF